MSLLSDRTIAELCGWNLDNGRPLESFIYRGAIPLVEPFIPESVNKDNDGNKIISYGLSSYGYDLRCGNKFKIFTNVNTAIVDPKGLDVKSFVDVEVEDGGFIIIPPNSFALTYSMERIALPRNITGVVLSKSTYARTGLICLATPLEAGWIGYVTLEFSNTTPLPMKLYAGEGCCQVLWFEGNRDCKVSYGDRNGKYQFQLPEVTLPRV